MFGLGRTAALTTLVATEGARFASKKDGLNMYEGRPLVEVTVCKGEELEDLQEALEAMECKALADDFVLPLDGGCFDALAICRGPAGANNLIDAFPGLVTQVAEDAAGHFRRTTGLAKAFDSRSNVASDFYSDWRTYEARMQRVAEAVANSNGVAVMETAGQTFEGRDIKLVRFTGSGYSSGKPKVVLTFNIHSREWISGMAGIYAVEQLIEAVKADSSYLRDTEVVMVPMANPDGMVRTETDDRFHRKNTNGVEDAGWFCTGGVDLNRNFAFSWASGGSSGNNCRDDFHGPSAASEPETQVFQNLMGESDMTVYMDVHAYTQLIMASWAYTRDDPPRKDEFDDLGKQMQTAVQNKHGEIYTYGTIANVIYPASGSTADYATNLGALGYAYELRPRRQQGSAGFAPPASEILPTSEECWEGIRVAIEYARTKR